MRGKANRSLMAMSVPRRRAGAESKLESYVYIKSHLTL